MKDISNYIDLGKADLHIHSNQSDGKPSIEEILQYVEKKTDLDVIAITDHDQIESAVLAKSLVEKGNFRFDVIVGEEISTLEGHIVGLFLKEKIPSGLSAHDALLAIKKQNGIAIAPHPLYHTRMRSKNMIIMDGVGFVTLIKEKKLIDGIEVINATPTLSEENLGARFVNDTILIKAETGSSDAHILDAIGKGYTIFEGKTAKQLRHSLKFGQTRAMSRHWSLMALLRYAFFFIPHGFRIALYTLLHGRNRKRPKIINMRHAAREQKEK